MKSTPSRSAGLAPVLALISLALALPVRGQLRDLACSRVPAGQAPHIDGTLTDPAWRHATWYDDFRQSVPDYGEPARQPTHVAFCYDDHNLYVAVRCDDDPALIRATRLRYRDEPANDDHVEVVFDTYRDQVRGTVFIVNPLGSKEEGLIDGYEHYTWSWDEVWDVRTAITDTGWQAELRIPFRVLRYGSTPEQVWDVNVARIVRRTQEASYLVPPRPPFDISSLNYAATLSGLELTSHQRNLQLIPYVLGGAVRETDPVTGRRRSRTLSEWGFDVKYSLTPGLTLDATYNTDFAQVEADAEQVNLTRFSLFYPEKREFFLENAQLFSFGHFGGGGPDHPELTPFFSRRIGLYEGLTVPLDAGLRLTGKVGREDVGILSVHTASLPGADLPSAWYDVVRVRHDLGERSYVGMILTDSRRGGFRSTTFGLDSDFFLTRELSLRADWLRVDDTSGRDPRDAANLSLDLTSDLNGFLFGITQVDDGFDPDLGYVRRDGYRREQAFLRRSIRPGVWGIRKASFRFNNTWYDSLRHDVLETASHSLQCDLEMENGDQATLQVTRDFERLFEPFALDPRVVFPTGGYTFTSGEIDYYSDDSKRLGYNAEAVTGDFYDGTTRQLGGDLWYVFSPHVRASGGTSTVDVSSPHGDLEWRLWSVRLDYIHSSTMSASGYMQYNSSNGTKVLNLRMRWILPNDSDLYLVYNDSREDFTGAPELRTRELAVKMNYRLFI